MTNLQASGKVVHVLGTHDFDLYIGRPAPRYRLAGSDWKNPFRIGDDGTREQVLAAYEEYARRKYAGRLHRIRGKTLACWCAPKDGYLTTEDETICHGQILLRLAEELS